VHRCCFISSNIFKVQRCNTEWGCRSHQFRNRKLFVRSIYFVPTDECRLFFSNPDLLLLAIFLLFKNVCMNLNLAALRHDIRDGQSFALIDSNWFDNKSIMSTSPNLRSRAAVGNTEVLSTPTSVAEAKARQRAQHSTDLVWAMSGLMLLMLLIAWLAKYLYYDPVPHQYRSANDPIVGPHAGAGAPPAPLPHEVF
jgi:hypothetical protein